MKKYLLLLALVTANVQATGVIAQGTNKDGSTVALTDAPCDREGTGWVYVYYPDGSAEAGCWASDQSKVYVGLPRSGLSVYPFSFFDNKGKLK